MLRTTIRRRCAVLLAFLLVSTPAGAQTDSPMLRLVAVHTEVPERLEALVEVPAAATAFEAQDFQLLEDGRPTVRATASDFFRTSGWTVAAVFAIDTSGSVGQSRLEDTARAMRDFVVGLPEADALALVTFDDQVRNAATFGTSRDQLRESLGALKAQGRQTLLHRALSGGLQMLEEHAGARVSRRIIVVSDGADESSDEANATDAIIDRAVALRVAIDTIWIGSPAVSRRNTLVRMSERTAGIHTDATDPDTVAEVVGAALTRVATRIDDALVLSFNRTVDGAAMTREVGVRLQGMAPGVMALQIPQSVESAAAGPWWMILLLGLIAVCLLYAAAYLLVRWRAPEWIGYFPFPRRSTAVIDDPPPDLVRRPRGPTVVSRAVAAGPSIDALFIDAIDGPLKGQRISVAHTHFQIGAGTDNDLPITSDEYLSSTHALFRVDNGHWLVLDQDSRNGTFVDDRRLASGRAHQLRHGQRIRVGASEFRVVLGEGASSASPSSPTHPEPVR